MGADVRDEQSIVVIAESTLQVVRRQLGPSSEFVWRSQAIHDSGIGGGLEFQPNGGTELRALKDFLV